jgi:hypothetical protein
MKFQMNAAVQMNALHDKILEEFPNLAGVLGVGGTDGEVIEFWAEEGALAPVVETRLKLIPVLQLWIEPRRLSAGPGQQALLKARAALPDGVVPLVVWAEGAREQAKPVELALSGGQGELLIEAQAAGRLVVDCSDERCLARARLEIDSQTQEVKG